MLLLLLFCSFFIFSFLLSQLFYFFLISPIISITPTTTPIHPHFLLILSIFFLFLSLFSFFTFFLPFSLHPPFPSSSLFLLSFLSFSLFVISFFFPFCLSNSWPPLAVVDDFIVGGTIADDSSFRCQQSFPLRPYFFLSLSLLSYPSSSTTIFYHNHYPSIFIQDDCYYCGYPLIASFFST